MMLFESLWNTIFSEKNYSTTLSGQSPKDEKSHKESPNSDTSKIQAIEKKSAASSIYDTRFAEDVRALEAAIGKIQEGSNLIFELQDLNKIVPRHRVRVEAYQGLKSALKRFLNVELTIKSLKTK